MFNITRWKFPTSEGDTGTGFFLERLEGMRTGGDSGVELDGLERLGVRRDSGVELVGLERLETRRDSGVELDGLKRLRTRSASEVELDGPGWRKLNLVTKKCGFTAGGVESNLRTGRWRWDVICS